LETQGAHTGAPLHRNLKFSMSTKNLNGTDSQERNQAAGQHIEGELPPAGGQEPLESPEAIKAERDRLARQNAELTDQLLRRRAEFDNFRKRIERERSQFYDRAAMDVIRALLPVLDGLQRALAGDRNGDTEFHQGIELIARQFQDSLAKFGLEPIEAAGKKFDPHLHQAVEGVETTDYEDQTVVGEWQRGYLFRGQLLRPAMVKVAVGPESQ
jgi:molecular chaperone GrpE